MLAIKRKRISKAKVFKPKTPHQMERHVKGVANHKRIEILFLIEKHGSITLDEICEAVNGNVKTICEHTIRLTHSGLIRKHRRGRAVTHSLSPYGKMFHHFLKSFSTET